MGAQMQATDHHVIVQRMSELPDTSLVDQLFLDVETISNNPKRGGVKPYHGDEIVGIAFTFNDAERAWYLPLRHKDSMLLYDEEVNNLPLDKVTRYVSSLFANASQWINHNLKFDAHFLANEGVVFGDCKFVDTLTLAKLVDMQSQLGGYGLKPLAKKWCGAATDEQDEVKVYLRACGSKDFGDVHAPVLGKYACADVSMNRELWKEIVRRMYVGIDSVWDMEVNLSKTLFDVERRGLLVDTEALARAREAAMSKIATIESEIEEMGFREVNLNSTKSIVTFVIETLGLPIIHVTDKGHPSVNSEAINAYLETEAVTDDEKVQKFFRLLDEHRDRSQFIALYAEGWLEHIDENERLHPSYNQTVRTGRMSCGSPNMQQLSSEAKQFIVPKAGNAFISRDYSQIEYRVIASLTQDDRILDAYRNNPETDFHQFIADLCSIERKPAKSVNFGIAFGMGERKLVRYLAQLLGSAEAEAEAGRILSTYHEKFPGIRRVSQQATRLAASRGWIRTFYGRRRALDEGFEHKAFNTAVQGTAADIMKERVVALNDDELLRDAGVTVRAIVHDEVLLEGPADIVENPVIADQIDTILTSPTIDLGLPLYVSGGTSRRDWASI